MAREKQAQLYLTIVRTGASEEPDDPDRLQRFAADPKFRDLPDPVARALLMTHAALMLVRAEPSVPKRLAMAQQTISSFGNGPQPSINDVLDRVADADLDSFSSDQLRLWSDELARALLDLEPN